MDVMSNLDDCKKSAGLIKTRAFLKRYFRRRTSGQQRRSQPMKVNQGNKLTKALPMDGPTDGPTDVGNLFLH